LFILHRTRQRAGVLGVRPQTFEFTENYDDCEQSARKYSYAPAYVKSLYIASLEFQA